MSFLLDTHALVWWMLDPAELSKFAHQHIKDRYQTLYVSAATAYEIEQKRHRSSVMSRMPRALESIVAGLGFDWLPIEVEDCQVAGSLSMVHRDPWDRIIAAQALRTGSVLLSKDEVLHQVGPDWRVPVLW